MSVIVTLLIKLKVCLTSSNQNLLSEHDVYNKQSML